MKLRKHFKICENGQRPGQAGFTIDFFLLLLLLNSLVRSSTFYIKVSELRIWHWIFIDNTKQKDHDGSISLSCETWVIISTKDTYAQYGHVDHISERTEIIRINFLSERKEEKKRIDNKYLSYFWNK